ncbi:reverse transcriptase domain-containing protein [Tanacetum coccineum]
MITPEAHHRTPVWTLYTDGTLSNEGVGAGLILTDPEGNKIILQVPHLQVFTDSLLVTNNVKRTYEARSNQAQYVLQEAHFGSCGAHTGATTIAQKVARLENFWPTMYCDATKIIEACVNCQQHAPIIRKPQCDMWVEAAPLATITGNNILKCIWNNIVCHFGIPSMIVSDNGKAKGQWVKELPNVPWAYRTTVKTDLLEERRDLATLREARYKQHMEQYYNSKVHHAYLKVGDFVLRKNEASRQEGQRKLDPN